jgi:hypothetical protein
LARWFHQAWTDTGKKLDMGKTCIGFRKSEDLALEVVGEVLRRVPARKFIAHYESVLKAPRERDGRKSGSGSRVHR